jgi:glyoxylase-like metal-dependent hydrolase (beta-lactamase superfamily II)
MSTMAAANAPSSRAAAGAGDARASLGMSVLERGWLSANQVVFAASGAAPATVVDTGFCSHAAQTLALVDHLLAGSPLGRLVNTHLHSDHCGGNAALQARGAVETWIPRASMDAVRRWNEEALSYRLTDQPCPRFVADRALVPGESIDLGPARWEIHAAPGHDMDAVMLFEPQTRTLISGDALWEDRLAIIFPDFIGADGWGPTRATLDLIERLAPREVVPGHGRPFGDVSRALAASRERVATFERQPERHAQHAARALLMFHLLEVRSAPFEKLVAWMAATPVYPLIARRAGVEGAAATDWARAHVLRLVDEGVLRRVGEIVAVPEHAQ